MKRTLVIIDVQDVFIDYKIHKDMISAICKQVAMAKRFKWNILVVEYRRCGRTHRLIMNAIGRYKRFKRIKKYDDDGAVEVMSAMIENRYDPFLRVCGLNSDACIMQTVTSLAEYNPSMKIELVLKGCGSVYMNTKMVLNDLVEIKNRRRRISIIKK